MQRPSIRTQFITLGRIFNTGLHNLFRNSWLSIAAIAVMTVTLTIMLAAAISNFAFQEAVDSISKSFSVSVFLSDDATNEEKSRLLADLNANDVVDQINFVSKEEALVIFQERYPELIAGIGIAGDNPVPASYEVVLNDINRYSEIIDIANGEQYVGIVDATSESDTFTEAFNNIISVRKWTNRASIVLGSIFGAISILVIFNTIRMAIFTRAKEIEIMKLIGATPGYIRGPYLVEASMYGIIAAFLSIGITYPVTLKYARTFLENISQETGSTAAMTESFLPGGVVSFSTEFWYIVFFLVVGTGIVIGYFSAAIAMGKYLRLKKW